MDLYKKDAALTDLVPPGQMTIREYTERKRMVLILATLGSLLLTLTWLTLGASGRIIVTLVEGGIWGFLIFLSMYGLRCPDCGKNLGHTLLEQITHYDFFINRGSNTNLSIRLLTFRNSACSGLIRTILSSGTSTEGTNNSRLLPPFAHLLPIS